LSRRYDEHPIFDLVYVALAERLGQRLVTADSRLATRTAGLGFVSTLGDL
jgi:predicted nucleic acid-binding protein